MSYSYTQKKPLHCHEQAIHTLQKIFPSVNLAQLSKNSSVWEMLEKSAKNLPRPGLGDITSTIQNMKSVVDNQELKIQKNMIEIEKQQEIIMSSQQKQFESKLISQPTAVKLLFESNFNQQEQSAMNEQQDYEKIEIQIENKQKFFADEDIDYFGPCQGNQMMGESFIDDDEEVKKYLAFDF